MKILAVRNLRSISPSEAACSLHGQRLVRALQAVDLDIEQGVTVGIVGESGCGKSTLGHHCEDIRARRAASHATTLTGICPRHHPGPPAQGEATFRRDVQMVFQNPYDSLDPRMTIRDIIRAHRHHRLFADSRWPTSKSAGFSQGGLMLSTRSARVLRRATTEDSHRQGDLGQAQATDMRRGPRRRWTYRFRAR